MSTYRAWYVSLAAFLLVPGPLPAQAQDEAPLKMIYAVFNDTARAASAVKNMTKGAKDLVQASAVLVKDSNGQVEVKQRHNKAGGSDKALQASQVVDTAIARLSAPLPTAADSASAYASWDGSPLVGQGLYEAHEHVRPRRISPDPHVAEAGHLSDRAGPRHGSAE